VRRLSALEVSLLLLLEPVLNPMWAWLVQRERPGAWTLLGGAIIIAAAAVKTVYDSYVQRGTRPIVA
jgi:drug/metabolite transporter (DMT)-like permease